MDHTAVPLIASDDHVDVGLCHVNPSGVTIGSYGLEPRNYSTHPVGYLAQARPFDLPLIPRSEWRDRLAALKAARAQLTDIRDRGMWGQPIPSRDQNGYGYCWAHSSTSACLLQRAVQGQPYADLSAFAPAAIIKGYRNRGGWGAESLEWIADNGIPTSETWPQRACDRKYDTPAMRAEAAHYKITEWMDMEPRNVDQLVTCLLLNIPVVSDFNWWGHSVCSADLVDIDPNSPERSIQTIVWNSWGDSWSAHGMGKLEGRKAIPDGMIAPRVVSGMHCVA